MVFGRMLGKGIWSHVDLTKYFVSVKGSLTTNELSRLKETRWLPKEGEEAVKEAGGRPVR
jgi:hypothetical protein